MKRENTGLRDIASEFFEIDDEAQITIISLKFERASDLFDETAATKIPMMSEDFDDWLEKAYDYVPSSHQLKLSVYVGDLEGYTEDELKRICLKNMDLAAKVREQECAATNRSVLCLCGLGMTFVLLGILVDWLWVGEGGLRDTVFFLMEIAATVPFWGAAETYFVESAEERLLERSYRKRFRGIEFHKADDRRA